MGTSSFLSAGSRNGPRLCRLLLAAVAAAQPALLLAQAQPDARNPGIVQLMNQVESLQADINKLRGQLEVLSNGLENAQKRQRDMYLDLDTRLRRIEQQSGDAARKEGQAPDLDERVKRLEQRAADGAKGQEPHIGELEARIKRLEQQLAAASGNIPPPVASTAPAPAAAQTAPAASPPTPPVKPTPSPVPAATTSAAATNAPSASEQSAIRKAYDSGITAYRAGDYQGAIAAFDGIVKRFPRDPLAANAQYWIGDAWFNLRDFKAAAAAQQVLIANYPESPKIPDALLNLGSAYAAQGDNPNARKTFEDLIARFPQTDAAEKAKARLARLR
jgi:tol-pal system protein YbgF